MLENWGAWRLVLSDGGFDYRTVFHGMSIEEIEDANMALDIMLEARKK